MTVAQRVDALLAAGLIREAGVGQSTGGRRPTELQFDHEHAILLLAIIDTMHTRIAAVDLLGTCWPRRRSASRSWRARRTF